MSNRDATQRVGIQAAILGSDLFLAALPADPVQIFHAFLELGYDAVLPASLGDELIAGRALEEIADITHGAVIMCNCPGARKRLLAAGDDLSPFLINVVSPPVATARHLRSAYRGQEVNIAFFGGCEGAADESINSRHTPAEFLAMCLSRGINLCDFPRVFDSQLPADRRRHLSLPGGLPTQDAVRRENDAANVVSVDPAGFATEVAQHIVAQRPTLVDLSCAINCACSGFVAGCDPLRAREAVMALEPPRSAHPVVDPSLDTDLEIADPRPELPDFEESFPLSVVFAADTGPQPGEMLVEMAAAHSSPAQNTRNLGTGRRDTESVPPHTDRHDREVVGPAATRIGDRNASDTLQQHEAPPGNSTLNDAFAASISDFDLGWDSADLGTEEYPEPPTSESAQSTPVSSPELGQTHLAHGGDAAASVSASDPQHRSVPTSETTPERVRTATGQSAPRSQSATPSQLPRAYMMLKKIRTASGEMRSVRSDSAQRGDSTQRAVAAQRTNTGTDDATGSGVPAPREKDRSAAPPLRGTVDSMIDMLSRAIRDVVDP